MFRNIIWDVDGTLFDTYPAIARAFQAALRDLGHDAPVDWLQGLAEVSMDHCFGALVGTYHVDPQELERHVGEHYGQIRPEDQPPFPGVVELCRHICSIGGKNVIVTHRTGAGAFELLAAHGMSDYFAGAIGREDDYPRKPDPAAFVATLERHGLSPAETLAVGDRDIDTQAARAAGLFTCLFDPDAGLEAADLVIGNFGELAKFLGDAQQG